jgi:ABC-type spermidine/putrescine transport system permease subunit II
MIGLVNSSSLTRMAAGPITTVSFAVLLAFGMTPLAAMLVLSFTPLDGGYPGLHFAGYLVVLDAARLAELQHVVARALIATIVAVGIGIPAAYFLRARARPPLQLTLLSLIVAPWLVSDMLRAFGWQLALAPDGLIGGYLSYIFGSPPLEGLRYNHVAAVVGMVSATLPTSIVSTFAALPSTDSTEWQAARELTGRARTFRLMTFGHARLGVAFGFCMTLLLCLFDSAAPQFLDGPTRTTMMTITSSLSNVGVSALMAFGIVMLMGAICFCVILALAVPTAGAWRAKRFRSHTNAPRYHARWPRLGRVAHGLSDAAAAVLPPFSMILALGLVLCPLVAVSIEAFRPPYSDGLSLGFANFESLMRSDDLLGALGNSAISAVWVSIAATATGFAISLATWETQRARRVLVVMLILALLPGELFALGLMQVSKQLGFVEGSAALAGIAQAVWVVPFATGSLMVANASIGRSVIEAALELGRSPPLVARDIVGRINWSAITASAVLSFTLILNENTRASYLGGSAPSISNQVFGRLQAGLLDDSRAIFALEFILVLSALASSQLILRVLLRNASPARR